jgi:hypothetical protein
MMMLSQSAVNEALALLSVIASPAATRERLDQLVAESQRAKDLFDQANAATQQLVADQKAWKEQTAAAAITAAEQQVGLERQREELERREKLLADFAARVATAEARVGALDEEIRQRETVLGGITAQLDALKARL